jgi:4-amino-4-deoxy-L-arabinose transferase-like glycosyltransferase
MMDLTAVAPSTREGHRDQQWALGLLALIAAFSLWRIGFAWSQGLGLFYDEAYYWHWAQDLAWGYYSKPPMVAWVIALTGHLWGDATPLAVKSGAMLIHPLTAFGLFALGRKLLNARAGFWAGALYFSAPGMAMSNVVISTDVPLLLFWTWGMVFAIRAVQGGAIQDWILVGLCGGLGLLSKYTMVVFAIGMLWVLSLPPYRHWLSKWQPYAAAGLALALWLPNVLWNYQQDFPTMRHTVEIAELDGELFYPTRWLEFIGAQFAVFGPVTFALFLLALGRIGARQLNDAWSFAFSLPMLLLISGFALMSHAHANWAVPAITAVCLLVAIQLTREGRFKLLSYAVVANVILGALSYHLPQAWTLVTQEDPPYKIDLAWRSRGWGEVGHTIQRLREAYPQAGLLSDDRALLASYAYASRDTFAAVRRWAPEGYIDDHYELTRPFQGALTSPMLFVTRSRDSESVLGRFEHATVVPVAAIQVAADRQINLKAWLIDGFRGYSAR